MREILFRAIDEGTQEWVYGYYCEKPSPFHIGKEHSIFDDKTISRYAIRSETVGQYTGLTDKNGKKIFEGDIIKRMWNGSLSIYQVVFDKYLAAFIGETKPYGMFTTFDGDGEWFEVIGNIHDNPELIKT